MASPRIQVVIDATADGLRKGVAQARGALDGLDDKLGSIGKAKPFAKLDGAARDLAENRLGPLGDAASLVGVELGGMSTATLAAGAAIAGVGAFVASGVGKFSALVDEVRKFREVTGQTWEESSRLLETFKTLGIEADGGSAAMARLAKSVDSGKLDQYGISVVTAKDGTVDLNATLGQVADKFNATTDPAQRATMASDLFGKSWINLTPILAQGSDGIARLNDSVGKGQIVTEQAQAAQYRYKMAMDDLRDGVDGLQNSLAEALIPALADLAKAGAEGIGKVNELNASMDKGHHGDGFVDGLVQISRSFKSWKGINEGFMSSIDRLDGELEGAYPTIGAYGKKSLEAAAAQKKTAVATKQATEAAEENARIAEENARAAERAAKASADLTAKKQAEAKALDEAKRAADAQLGAFMSLASQELSNKQAHDGFTKATEELAKATEEEYAPALDAAKEAALRAVDADVELARKTAEATGGHLEARDALDVQRDALKKLRDATGDPVLAAYLDEQIGRIDRVRDAAYGAGSALSYMAEQSRAAAIAGGANVVPGFGIAGSPDRLERNATGGNVAGGVPTMVGEAGPEMFVPQSNGRILTADDLARVGGSGGGVVINVNTPIGRPDDVVRWLREELRRADRAQR